MLFVFKYEEIKSHAILKISKFLLSWNFYYVLNLHLKGKFHFPMTISDGWS